MKIRALTGRVGASLLAIVFLGATSAPVLAATITTSYSFAEQPNIFLTELQTGSNASASEEFIELYNNSDNDIDFSDALNGGKTQWKLQYFSKTKLSTMLTNNLLADGWNVLSGASNTPTKTIVLSGVVQAHSYFVVSTSGYMPGNIESDMSFASGMASDGGALQLVSVQSLTASTTKTIVHDRLAWAGESVLSPQSEWAYLPPSASQTLQRKLNDEDRYHDDQNVLEAWQDGTMTPKASWMPVVEVEPTEPEPPVDDSSSQNGQNGQGGENSNQTDGDVVPVTNEGLAMPYLTELLPNPSSDESDEYVELYNPNDEPFNLKGYELQTGISSIHSFVFTSDTLLPAESYTVLTYADTKLALANSGGRAKLLNSTKQLVDETEAYASAKESLAWALDSNGSWKWTDTATPKLANVFTNASPLLSLVSSKSAKSAKVKGVSTKKAKIAKVKKAKTPKLKKVKKPKKQKTKQFASMPSAAEKSAVIHPGALAVVAVAALAYIGYEYRKDIANFFAKFRRH